MAMKKPKNTPARFRTKEARELAKKVTDAGGTVSMTGPGAMRIDGPAGHTTVSQKLPGIEKENAMKQIRRRTGLEI